MRKIPSLKDLEKINNQIKNIPNKQGEFLRKTHYCCFLLCHKSGLRVNEAINFDYNQKHKELYRISKSKNKKERFVYIPKKVIKELKKHDWKPNSTNRWNFYNFLRKIKRELNISESIELTPHTLRRAFTTYYAEAGLSLPILSKMLGHKSVRTTALYWMNTHYGDDDDDNSHIGTILIGKEWLENNEKKELEPPTPKPLITDEFPTKPEPKTPEFSLKATQDKPIFPKENVKQIENNQNLLTQEYSAKQFPSENNQELKEKSTNPINTNITEINNQAEIPNSEPSLSEKIQQLQEQLKQTQTENKILKEKLVQETKLKQKEKARADYYETQIKTITKILCQWQKINYYQQQEKQNELKAQIVQVPPFKFNK